MNFLAHLHIADHTGTSLPGALAADFIRGQIPESSSAFLTGVRLHRYVDAWVDQHSMVLDLKSRFDPAHRRMAGILLDMAFDHQLAGHWPVYHDWTLERFSQHCYSELHGADKLPPRLTHILPFMSRDDWLSQYQHREGIERSIEGIARRMSRPEVLKEGIYEIWRLEFEIHRAFASLYPELLEASQSWLAKQATGST
ncbi:MAG: ACP phosphodiesterase [Endozoicomonas sp.]